MSLTKKSKVKILEYKLLFEEKELVDKEFEEGSIDLNYRLSFFKKKLVDDKSGTQSKRFNDMFYNNKIVNQHSNLDTIEKESESVDIGDKSSVDHTPWAKKLYRSIVSITHPDKTASLPSQSLIKKFTDLYMLAVTSFEESAYANLILIAYDLSLPLDESWVDGELAPAINNYQKEIQTKKTLMGYFWYHVSDDKKEFVLKNYLNQLGFAFTSEQVQEVVRRKYIKRKVGTRPPRMNLKTRKPNM